jgi:hypothetical protein
VLFPKKDQIQSTTVILHPANIIAEKETLKAMDTHPGGKKMKNIRDNTNFIPFPKYVRHLESP